jgi:hypothetical protein
LELGYNKSNCVEIMIWVWSLLASVAYAVHINFQLDLTWKEGSPDGNRRQMVLMNNQFPGPQLTLNFGDTVQVRRPAFGHY